MIFRQLRIFQHGGRNVVKNLHFDSSKLSLNMTRFARPSKKTSLEATPWHQLVNSGGKHSSKTGKKTASKDNQHSVGMKRKNSNVDDESVKPQKVKKSGSREGHSKAEKDGSNVGPLPKKKNWTKGFKLKKDNHKIMKRRRLETHKNTEKNKIKLSTSGNRTETLDKKHEARRKRRAKGKACFNCRQTGHLVSECPLAQDTEMGVGYCYKCGSSEHTTKNCSNKSSDAGTAFPFAKCFICGETGHISRACPDNPKGLYPNGGGCKICGSVEHFRRDCPELVQKTKGSSALTHVQNMKYKKGHYSADAELEDDGGTVNRAQKKKGPSVVKF